VGPLRATDRETSKWPNCRHYDFTDLLRLRTIRTSGGDSAKGCDGVFVYHGTFTMAAPARDQLLTRLEAAQRRVGEIRPARGRKAFLAEVSRGRDR